MKISTVLTLADAQKVLNVIQSELERSQEGAAIAVVDEHGELLAFARTDGCPLPSIYIAINKAYTAEQTGGRSLAPTGLPDDELWRAALRHMGRRRADHP